MTTRAWRPSAYGVGLITAVVVQLFVVFTRANRSQITQPGRLVLYAVATLAVALVALAVVQRRSGSENRDRWAVVVAVVVSSFLNYSALFDPDPSRASRAVAALLAWVVLTALLARLAYLVSDNDTVRFGVLVFAAAMVFLPLVGLMWQSFHGEPAVLVSGPGEIDVPEDRPNVYWLMLDGYARPDVLQQMVGVDDGDFVAGLEERGFQVSASSRASYPRTLMSLASTLQMDYVLEPGHDVTDDFALFTPVVLGRNETTARFRALGYRTVYGDPGSLEWWACHREWVDECLPPRRPSLSTGELEGSLLDHTPLGLVNLPVAYADPVWFADGIEDADLPEPFFAFQHLMSPHEPYRYDAGCNPRSVPVNRRSLTGPEQHREYATQVQCVNELVLAAVDEIVERDPDAIILVQSDHGSDFSLTWDEADPEGWAPGQLRERYGAFNAMRLPRGCPIDIEGQALVNTFRIVFACIEGTEPQLLDYRAFVQPLADVSKLAEVDEERFQD